VVSKPKAAPCDQCAADAFVQWADDQLGPAFNSEIAFNPPQGQRLVIEFVTATVEVPAGESARLRMFTGFSNGQAGNFDLALTLQGVRNGQSIYDHERQHAPTSATPRRICRSSSDVASLTISVPSFVSRSTTWAGTSEANGVW
jgi:hypothetical protein